MASPRNASALVVLLILGCGGSGGGSVDKAAHLRFFDALSDTSNVRLNVGSRLFRAGGDGPSFENGAGGGYGDVPSGTIDLTLRTYDQTSTLATLTSQRLLQGAHYTAVALTTGSTKKLLLLRDAATPSTGAALFRVVNAYTTTTPLYLQLFKDSDNSLAYKTNTTSGTGLASGGTLSYQPVNESATDGSSYTLQVYDTSDFQNPIATKSATLKTSEPLTFFLYNKRSSSDMAIRAATDQYAND